MITDKRKTELEQLVTPLPISGFIPWDMMVTPGHPNRALNSLKHHIDAVEEFFKDRDMPSSDIANWRPCGVRADRCRNCGGGGRLRRSH